MNKFIGGITAAASVLVATNVAAYDFDVVEEVDYPGPIIRVVEWGADNRIGVWVYFDEGLVLHDEKGAEIARCDTIIPADDIFGEYGGSSVNIEGTKVQYAGVDGTSLAGYSIDCVTGEFETIGGFIPTFNHPDGNYRVGYSGDGTRIYYPDGTDNLLHNLSERIYYYSGNDDGTLLAGYKSTATDFVPYASDRGQIGTTKGLAVVRVTPFGDTIVVGTLSGDSIIRQSVIITEDNITESVDPEFIIADANLDGFIFNRFETGDGAYGPDLFGNDCYIIDEKEEIAKLASTAPSIDIDPDAPPQQTVGTEGGLTLVYEQWCQSFVRQEQTIYVAVGESWMNSTKLLKLDLNAEVTQNVAVTGTCVDAPPLGDGWGWDGVQSCRILAESDSAAQVIVQGNCFDSPPLGDGWGWDGVNSCRLSVSDSASQIVFSGDCYDAPPLNNGWGWDGVNSCPLTESYSSAEMLVNGNCYDLPPMGDGYGWNGEACSVTAENATATVVVAAEGECVDAPPFGNGYGNNGNGSCRINIGAIVASDGLCVDTLPFGDGWGYDGSNGCLISTGAVLSADGNCVDTAPLNDGWGWDGTDACRVQGTEVDSDRNGCVDTSPTGDGWGWDGTASCRIIY